MMATKASKIELTQKQAAALLTLYNNTEAADSAFKSCQSDLFRQFVHDTYTAKDVEDAFLYLRRVTEHNVE